MNPKLPIYCYNATTRKLVRTYPDIYIAAQFRSVTPAAILAHLAGRTRQTAGYLWSREKFDVLPGPLQEPTKYHRKAVIASKQPFDGHDRCTDLQFESMASAAELCDTHTTSIRRAIRERIKAGGYYWRYKE